MPYGAFPYGAVELGGNLTPIVVPTPPANKRFTLFIGGVDRTSLMLVNTLRITNLLSQASTAQLALRDQTGTFHATIGQDVQVFSNTTKVFGGTIDEVTESAYQARSDIYAFVKCTDYSGLLDRRIVGNFYTGYSMSAIVSAIVYSYLQADGFTYNTRDGDPGITLGDQLFQWVTVRQAFNQLSSATGWEFIVDYNKAIRFFPSTSGTGAAPFNIADNDGNVLAVSSFGATNGTGESATIRTYRGPYANRVFVTSSSQASPLWTDIFSASNPGPYPSNKQPPGGGRYSFITLFPINQTPTVKVNGNSQRVIPLSQVATANPSTWDWYWIPPSGGFANGGAGVFQNQANPRLVTTDVLEVDYQTALSPATSATCSAEVASRASAEGNSGFYDAVFSAPDITDPTALSNYATFLLNRYGCTNGLPKQVIYATVKDGLFAGMLQTINLSQPLIASHNYLISQIVARDVDKDHMEYQVTCDFGNYQGTTSDQFFASVISQGNIAQPGNFEQYIWPLAPTFPGYTNGGLASGGVYPMIQAIKHPVETPLYVSVVFNSLPANPTGNFQLYRLRDGSGVGAQMVPLVVGVEVRFYFVQPATKMIQGEAYQVLVQGGNNSSFKDGTFTLVTSVAVA